MLLMYLLKKHLTSRWNRLNLWKLDTLLCGRKIKFTTSWRGGGGGEVYNENKLSKHVAIKYCLASSDNGFKLQAIRGARGRRRPFSFRKQERPPG